MGGNRELVLNGMEFSVWEDEKVLEMNGGDGLHDSMNGFNATEPQT